MTITTLMDPLTTMMAKDRRVIPRLTDSPADTRTAAVGSRPIAYTLGDAIMMRFQA